MLVQKGFKYKLYPTDEQKQLFLQHAGNARFIWNLFLEQNIEQYRKTKEFKFFYELATSLPKLKEKYDFLKVSVAQSLQTVARQFDRALKDSFKTKKGFPQFKKKCLLKDSFSCPQKWKINKNSVSIPKIGNVKWVKHRPLQGKPKSITITQDGDRWFCSVLCEYEIEEKIKKEDNIIGIDLGLKEFAVFSDETVISNPRYTNKKAKKLKKEQRRLSRKQKRSKNRFKQRMKVKRVHVKIRNARQDFLHKITSNIITKYDGVVLEDLNVKGMVKNHKLAKSISDVSWNEFRRQLEYKCKWNSKHFILIDRYFPSTKTCSGCGAWKDMPLDLRFYDCPKCGLHMDRDLNAAINIREKGLDTLGRREIKACGVPSVGGVSTYVDTPRYGSVKQEKECLVN